MLRTWANPRRVPPFEILSTAMESTFRVSTVTSGPKMRPTEAATLAGGGAWALATETGHSPDTAISARRAAPGPILELIADSKTEQLALRHARLGTLEL